MKYFPFYIDLKKKSVLLIGGGEVAERKLDLLIKAKANVTLISPETTLYILDIAEKNNINIINEEYSSQYLDKKYSFVIAATNNEKLNKSIALGMVKPELGNPGQKLKIDILGKMHEATILDESPYDPENKLLRA